MCDSATSCGHKLELAGQQMHAVCQHRGCTQQAVSVEDRDIPCIVVALGELCKFHLVQALADMALNDHPGMLCSQLSQAPQQLSRARRHKARGDSALHQGPMSASNGRQGRGRTLDAFVCGDVGVVFRTVPVHGDPADKCPLACLRTTVGQHAAHFAALRAEVQRRRGAAAQRPPDAGPEDRPCAAEVAGEPALGGEGMGLQPALGAHERSVRPEANVSILRGMDVSIHEARQEQLRIRQPIHRNRGPGSKSCLTSIDCLVHR
mmetsp:Transcript_71515/g.201984  ORF Transcript_71515/g.201984 Transcript_71515/m.201984 type:complete len:263 (+) Transcript_71515:595-1383(+)